MKTEALLLKSFTQNQDFVQSQIQLKKEQKGSR